jgi:hypothetical protein
MIADAVWHPKCGVCDVSLDYWSMENKAMYNVFKKILKHCML